MCVERERKKCRTSRKRGGREPGWTKTCHTSPKTSPKPLATNDHVPSTASSTHFLNLPLELRRKIYNHAIGSIVFDLPHVTLPPLFSANLQICTELYSTMLLEARLHIWTPEWVLDIPQIISLDEMRRSISMVRAFYAAGYRRLRLHVCVLDTVVTGQRVGEIMPLLEVLRMYTVPRPKLYFVPKRLDGYTVAQREVLRKVRSMMDFAEEARGRDFRRRGLRHPTNLLL